MTRLHALQLKSGHDLLDEIENYVEHHGLGFAVVVSAVGSLSVARIRPAVSPDSPAKVIELAVELEIVSLSGMLVCGERPSSHLHLAVADTTGTMAGGHLKQGCQIRLGAKIVLISGPELEFDQPEDGHQR